MKYIMAFVVVLCAPVLALAQDMEPVPAVVTAPPLLVTLLLLVSACACVAFAVQVFMLIKGGQLSRGWLILTGGFVVLAISQVVTLLAGFGVIPASRFLIPALLIVMTGLFGYGLYETKRTLS
ncbi:MAG: hypothetical protein WAU88_12450 [Candidatus Zixiibacteriota bacterium]